MTNWNAVCSNWVIIGQVHDSVSAVILIYEILNFEYSKKIIYIFTFHSI